MTDKPTPPSPLLPPDPLDPIIARADALTLNRAISTAPSAITDADLGLLVDVLRRDRARFQQAEKKRADKAEGIEEPETDMESPIDLDELES